MPVPFNKIRNAYQVGQTYQTGQSAGSVDRTHPVSKLEVPRGVVVQQSHLLPMPVEDVLHVMASPKRCTLVLTPFLAEYPTQANPLRRYAERAVRDSIRRNESPISTNLFYYAVLNIRTAIEKDIGLMSMLSWVSVVHQICVYVDYGVTPAMELVTKTAKMKQCHLEYRNIYI